MSFGLVVRNQDDRIQIDASYSNMGLVHQGFVYPNTHHSGGAADCWLGTVSLGGLGAPVIALRSVPGNSVTIFNVLDNGGGGYTFTIASENQGAEVEYFVFDPLEYHSVSGNQFGLLVNDGGGVRRYDSRYRSLRILDFLSYNDLAATDSQTYGGKKVAVIFSQVGRRYWGQIVGAQPNVNGYVFYVAMMIETPLIDKVNVAQGVLWGAFFNDPGTVLFPSTIVENTFLLVVDVTGF